MKNTTKSLAVPVITACTLGWAFFASQAVQHATEQEEDVDTVHKYSIEEIQDLTIDKSYQHIYDEYERLKEEERKKLEELERQRLEKLEKERLAKIEEEKKQKQLAEEKRKKELAQKELAHKNKIVYNDNNGTWQTFNGSYYASDCYKCSGITATGIDVRNSIYYGGYRIIALDPNVIPLWSIVEVQTPTENFKAIVADTGGRIKGYHADILVQSEAVARQYGRHNIQIRKIGKYNK